MLLVWLLLLAAAGLAAPLAAAPLAGKTARHGDAPFARVPVDIVPHARPSLPEDARPAQPRAAQSEEGPPIDMSKAMPGKALGGLPPSARQLGDLKDELARDRPAVDSARQTSESLAAQAHALRKKLVDTAARIETLEREKIALADRIEKLQAEDAALSAGFARDRISVTRLLAILERLQHDMPPALAVRPDDALAAARGAMLIGAYVPPVYHKAAELAQRITRLKNTRLALLARRSEAAATAASLAAAQGDLEKLTAQKELEAAGAVEHYGSLKLQLAAIAAKAADFQALVSRVASLRRGLGGEADQSIVTVSAANGGQFGPLTKGSLLPPVVGTLLPPITETAKNPGLTLAALPGAQVIAPADSKVLFAGPYHKSGQVLILEITTGYDLVLAGLGRVTVHPNDELLAGEPVGTMPVENSADRAISGSDSAGHLYFEVRQNGHGLDPEPWLSLDLRKAKKT